MYWPSKLQPQQRVSLNSLINVEKVHFIAAHST